MANADSAPAASWVTLFRLSLRELLILIALVALAIVSFKYASENWRTCVYVITMAFFMWGAVIAIIDRGQQQAYAIGMVLFMATYALILHWFGTASEQAPSGKLPTTKIARYLYRPVVTTYWYDRNTRQEIPDPEKAPPGSQIASRRRTSPPAAMAMSIAHCWWALLLGFIGARFAQVVYLRRTRKMER